MSTIGATAPPASGTINGQVVEFAPIIEVVAHRYFADGQPLGQVPEDLARGWLAHDTAYLLRWAMDDVAGYGDLDRELRWLADVLHHRNFPLTGLAANLGIIAEVIATNTGLPAGLAARLHQGARLVREIDVGLRSDSSS